MAEHVVIDFALLKSVCRWAFTDCVQKAKTLLQASGVRKSSRRRSSAGLGLKLSKTDETDGKDNGDEWVRLLLHTCNYKNPI